MPMEPSVVKAFSKSISAYKATQYATKPSLESYAPYLLRRQPLTTIKEFRQVNLPNSK